jgi:hypothetical protein
MPFCNSQDKSSGKSLFFSIELTTSRKDRSNSGNIFDQCTHNTEYMTLTPTKVYKFSLDCHPNPIKITTNTTKSRINSSFDS